MSSESQSAQNLNVPNVLMNVPNVLKVLKSECAQYPQCPQSHNPVSYTHLRAHETKANLVCRLLLEKKKVCIKI